MSAIHDSSGVSIQSPAQTAPGRGREIATHILLLVIVVGFYWKLVFTRQFDWIWGPDLAQQVLPWFEEQARQIHHGGFPLWDPHSWGGQPLLAQAQPGTAYPLNWLLWLIPLRNGLIRPWALQWYFVAIHYMAAVFAYLLCRDLARGRPASLIAGLMFGLAGYVGTTDWPQMLNGAVWAPLVVMFVLRAARGVRPHASAAFAGVSLGLAWLSGHHEAPIYITLATAGLWLYYFFENRGPHWGIARLAVLALLFSAVVGALQILPSEEYGRLALRWAPDAITWHDRVPYRQDAALALSAYSLFGVVFPGIRHFADPFMGVVGFGLALLGIALAWRQSYVKVFAALSVGALVFTLGNQSVLHGLIYSVVPWVEKARVPGRALLIFNMAAVVLAAYGVDHLISGPAVWVRRIVAGLTAFGLLTLAVFFSIFAARKLLWDFDDRVILTPVMALMLAALIYAWRNGNLTARAAHALAVLLLIQEIGNGGQYMLADRSDKDRTRFTDLSTGNKDIAAFLHAQPGVFRVDTATDDLVGNWGDYYNLDFYQAYLASLTEDGQQFDQQAWQTKMLFGIRYTLARQPVHDGEQEVFTGASGIKVYRNEGAFPRAWTVHDIVHMTEPAHGRAIIDGYLDQLHRRTFMADPAPNLASCPGEDAVSITGYAPSRISVRAEMNCTGMLVVSNTFFPGWHARVDGAAAEIHRVNFAMQGVVIPKGRHEVAMTYRPWSVLAGGILTLAGLAAAVWLGAASRRTGAAKS